MDNRKIVYVINTLRVGGAAKMLKYVANLSTEVFDEVSIISIYDTDYDSQDILPQIKVCSLGFENVSRIKRQFLMVSAIRKAIKGLNPKYVCAFVGHVNVMVRLATWTMKDIVMMSAERGDPYTQPLLWKWITKWAYNNSDYCFFQLEKQRDFFGKRTISKSFVIPNPFVVNSPVKPYYGTRKKTIVSAGRFGFEKCYNDLIEAFYMVHRIHPEYRLVLYGEGPMLPKYKKQVSNLGIKDFVSFPGYVKSVAQEIQMDGIFVLSSLFEGIPNSLIEAMSIGIPCVATNCTPGGPEYLFKSEKRGILVNVHDIKAMAGAICRIIENPQFAREIGVNAVSVLDDLKEAEIHQLWLKAFYEITNG